MDSVRLAILGALAASRVGMEHSDVLRANGLMVIALSGRQVSSITRFDNSNLARFGLPRTLDA